MATLYFNNAIDGDWQTLGNWWQDSGCTNPAVSLPSISDDVHILNTVAVNSGSVPTVHNMLVSGIASGIYISIEITVTGLATLDGGNVYLYTATPENEYAIINGNCLFLNGASTDNIVSSIVNGNATFEQNTGNYGLVDGDAIFNQNSVNYGSVTQDATFNHNSVNFDGDVTGNAEFNDASYTTVDSTIGTFLSPTRTPYPLRLGINNSDILGLI